MSGFLITYDLRAPGRNYENLHNLLARTWQAERVAESVWIAALVGPVTAIRDAIARVTDVNDRIAVIELSGNFAWTTRNGLPSGVGMLSWLSP